MPQTSGTFPPAYSNLVTAARSTRRTKANPFPLASAIQQLAQTAPQLPPLKRKRSAQQDRAIFAKTRGR